MLTLLLILVGAAILFSWIRLQRTKKKANISGWVVNSDLDGKGKFYKGPSGIVAKPDVLIIQGGKRRVKETKSGICKSKRPYKGHMLQVAAEMEATGASEGILEYSNKTFLIHQTPELAAALENVRTNLVETRRTGEAPEATPTRGKCRRCDFYSECPEAEPAH